MGGLLNDLLKFSIQCVSDQLFLYFAITLLLLYYFVIIILYCAFGWCNKRIRKSVYFYNPKNTTV